MSEPLVVLFEDAHCLAVAKPSGLLSQVMPNGEPSLEDEVRRYLCQADPASVYLGPVHRLDKPVSGAIVWAKTPKDARRLSDQFMRRTVHKEYWAVVEGSPATDEGIWNDWLCIDRSTGLGRGQVCSPQAPRARQATTRFQKRQAEQLPAGCTWLRLWPETGRTHQIRVQAAARGLLMLGDWLYGSQASFPRGISLHARTLTFRHPALHQPVTVTAPLPSEWSAHGIILPTSDGQSA
jgi:23S rRNA pseudouridine1911/1915/1917 synthase